MITYNLVFFGKVKKVNFRRTFLKVAKLNSINGFIQNKKDCVYAIIQNEDRKKIFYFLENVKKFLENENRNIKIKDFKFVKIETNELFYDFKIKYFSKLDNLLSSTHSIFVKKKKFKIPNCIGIIPDGNRRWLKKNGNNQDKIRKKVENNIVKSYDFLMENINSNEKYTIIFWAFSTENWRRGEEDKKLVFENVFFYLEKAIRENLFKNINFDFIGRCSKLPKEILQNLNYLKLNSNKKSNLKFVLAIDYGGSFEIIDTIKKIPKDKISNLDEKNFLEYLNLKEKVDLVIRTGFEKRLSGFLPFQIQYSEIFFIDKLFPDFNLKDFKKCILKYNKTKKNFGK